MVPEDKPSVTLPTALFLGYGSEYSLHRLCAYMEANGDQCVEIDMLSSADCGPRLQALAGKPLIFLTSAHPLYDHQNFSYYRTERVVYSALHVISTLRPRLSVFYPHDYKDPVKDEEIPYLPLFDLLLWPFDAIPRKLGQLVKTVPVGWINNPVGGSLISPVQGRAVFFLGAYQYYLNAGFDAFYQDFRALLTAGVAVKLSRWHDNDRFEAFLKDKGVEVVPSAANSVDVMKSCEIVYTHALSSVCLEACHLGKKVVYILNPRFDYLNPLEAFHGAGNIAFVDSPAAAVEVRSSELPTNICSMKEFDFAAARATILDEYAKRAPA